ncbi:MAG: hypothetical protein ACYSOI_09830 [Planctomycetota bacterium]|jgi:hypothetical protein
MHFWLRELKHFYYEMEDRWQRLGVKEWIEWHPRAVIGITIACFLVFVMIAIAQLTPDTPNPPEESKQTWFYDLNTKKLFIAKSSKLPPIKTASGELPDGTPAGVRAYVFMPTDQQQPTEPFIGFLETLSPEGRKIQKSYAVPTINNGFRPTAPKVWKFTQIVSIKTNSSTRTPKQENLF